MSYFILNLEAMVLLLLRCGDLLRVLDSLSTFDWFISYEIFRLRLEWLISSEGYLKETSLSIWRG